MSKTNNMAAITAVGKFLPEKRLTNLDLEKLVETSDEWIRVRTGIEERRIVEKGQASSYMSVNAFKNLQKNYNVNPKDVDAIIVATVTPDMLFPSTACFVQNELQAFGAAAYDISAVCSGFVFGLSIVEQYLKNGRYENILLIGSEVNSRIVDWTDRSTCILFGDGAGALLLKRVVQENPLGILSTHIYSDGRLAGLICVPGSIGREGFNKQDLDETVQNILQ